MELCSGRLQYTAVEKGDNLNGTSISTSLAVIALSVAQAAAQESTRQSPLYLLSGDIGGPIDLYKLDVPYERPELVRRLSESSDFVLSDRDRKRLVVGSPWPAPSSFSVVNMKNTG